jgi:hypothetical protein
MWEAAVSRIQVVLTEEEREVFRRRAKAEGLSLSGWLREAGRDRVRAAGSGRFESPAQLRAFFEGTGDGPGREPDWEEHRKVIERSRSGGRAEN